MSKDPIAEEGGINRYTFIFNDSLNIFDYLGLKNCALECKSIERKREAMFTEWEFDKGKLFKFYREMEEIYPRWKLAKRLHEMKIKHGYLQPNEVDKDYRTYTNKYQLIRRKIGLQEFVLRKYYLNMWDSMAKYNKCVSECEMGWYCRKGSTYIGIVLASAGFYTPKAELAGLLVTFSSFVGSGVNSMINITVCEKQKANSVASLILSTTSVTLKPISSAASKVSTVLDVVVNLGGLFRP